jgi:DNA-binding XRE family transcriptional regulator
VRSDGLFVTLGERIAALRREHNVTQVQLAEALGVSQQTMQSYEVGRRRIVSARPSHLEFEVVASNDHVHERDHGHDGYGQEANPA